MTVGEIAERARLVRGAAVVKGDFVFAVPGDLDTPTGGYAYDRRMIAELRALGWRPRCSTSAKGFRDPSALTRAAAQRACWPTCRRAGRS